MRALAIRALVLLLIWLLSPGLTEATENLWHLAVAGHSAHALDQGADHQPEDAEHGCSGTFHLCSCHGSPSWTLIPETDRTPLPGLARLASRPACRPESPPPIGLFRPPRA